MGGVPSGQVATRCTLCVVRKNRVEGVALWWGTSAVLSRFAQTRLRQNKRNVRLLERDSLRRQRLEC